MVKHRPHQQQHKMHHQQVTQLKQMQNKRRNQINLQVSRRGERERIFLKIFNLDNLFKRNNLNDLKSFEDKFYALANKYNDQLDQNKQKDNQIKDLQKHIVSITKARDSYQQENSKSLLARNKLESLCRELQRHNKAIKVFVFIKISLLKILVEIFRRKI